MSKNDTSHVSDNHGNNLMLLGASRGKLTIIQGALEHCTITDVHDKNDFGETALHLAAKHFYTSKLVSAGESMFFSQPVSGFYCLRLPCYINVVFTPQLANGIFATFTFQALLLARV